MSAAVETMMYVGETPWHGLGVKLETAPATVAEALKLAGLNWNVALKNLFLDDGTKIANRFAVVRNTDKRVLGTVGKGFRPVQNERAFSFFDPFLAQGVATIDTAGSLHNGQKVWMLAKIDRPDSVIVKKADDRVAKYLVLANGHDGSLALSILITPIRVVCQNTLSAALNGRKSATIKIRHTSGADDAVNEVQHTIERLDHDFEEAANVFRALAKRPVTAAQIRQYVNQVFQIKEKKAAVDAIALMSEVKKDRQKADLMDEILDAKKEKDSRVYEEIVALFEHGKGNDVAGVKGTAWGLYNAATEQLSWHRGKDANNRLDALWMRGAGISQRALASAQEIFLGA